MTNCKINFTNLELDNKVITYAARENNILFLNLQDSLKDSTELYTFKIKKKYNYDFISFDSSDYFILDIQNNLINFDTVGLKRAISYLNQNDDKVYNPIRLVFFVDTNAKIKLRGVYNSQTSNKYDKFKSKTLDELTFNFKPYFYGRRKLNYIYFLHVDLNILDK